MCDVATPGGKTCKACLLVIERLREIHREHRMETALFTPDQHFMRAIQVSFLSRQAQAEMAKPESDRRPLRLPAGFRAEGYSVSGQRGMEKWCKSQFRVRNPHSDSVKKHHASPFRKHVEDESVWVPAEFA